jgi:hypothetical protein
MHEPTTCTDLSHLPTLRGALIRREAKLLPVELG